MSISAKIYAVAALNILIAAIIVAFGVNALMDYDTQVGAMTLASKRAVVGERVNGLINAVVMDSRGVYMSRNSDEVEKYARPIEADLREISRLMAEWTELLPPDQRASIAGANLQAAHLVEFRSELLRLARDVSLADARSYGDNDASRINRQDFNKAISSLAATNDAEVSRLATAMEQVYRSRLWAMAIAGIVGIAMAMGLAGWVARRQIGGPIVDITGVMTALAAGELATEIPATARRDEIGDMAKAVAVFKQNALDHQRMETCGAVACRWFFSM